MDVSQLRKLKELEDENSRLRHIYADLALDNHILREVIEKNSRVESRTIRTCSEWYDRDKTSFCKTLAPGIRKEIAGEIVEEYKVSITRACCLMEIHKSYYYYESRKDDSGVEEAIRAKAADSSVGSWKIFDSLRNDGYEWNHKRVYRIYKDMKFQQAHSAPQAASGTREESAGQARGPQNNLVHGLRHRYSSQRTQVPRAE
jgi:putative transposase